jgi:glycosyltransferase involved in cell wall biosynthesis
MAVSDPPVTIVIPVHDGAADVEACLATIVRQATARAGAVIVVDDASTDDTADRARVAGAEVRSLTEQRGPYAARNVGWRASRSPVIVFTDVRNRAEPGWLDGLVHALDDAEVAVAGGHVRIGGDERLAHRLARRQSHVDPEPLLADDFLPYVTTSSMAVRRAALEQVGGFEERRSGADADLCWRIQQAGCGRVVLAPESWMVCEPRSSLRDIWRQWRRYARSYVEVRSRHGDAAGAFGNAASVRQELRDAARRVADRPSDLPLEVADAVRWLGYEVAYRSARRRARSG